MAAAPNAATDKPTLRVNVHPGGIPAELKERRAWVCWRWAKRNGKWTKVPKQVNGWNASTTDPTTWTDFETVCKHAEKLDGIGVCFDGDLCGIDLDDCVDPATGEVQPWAQAIVDRINSYTEITPSGTGLHILMLAKLPEGRRRKGSIEMYGVPSSRFFTVTGRHVSGTPTTVEARYKAFSDLHVQMLPRAARVYHPLPPTSPVDATDAELLTRARAAKNGASFIALFDRGDTGAYHTVSKDGTTNEGRSEGDLALCSYLAFWTGRDPARMDGLFRRSALMRSKWDERHGAATYGQGTIRKALDRVTESYSLGSLDDWTPDSAASGTGLVRLPRQLLWAELSPVEVMLGAVSAHHAQAGQGEPEPAAIADLVGLGEGEICGPLEQIREAGIADLVSGMPSPPYFTASATALCDRELSLAARYVLIVYSSFASSGHVEWSRRRAVERTGFSRRHLLRLEGELAERGHLVVVVKPYDPAAGVRKGCNGYYVNKRPSAAHKLAGQGDV
jgi:putative DNA primase/helicase